MSTTTNIINAVNSVIIDQHETISAIAPYITLYQSGLSEENRPVGAILLLGPTGSGKTATVEALANHVHGGTKNVLRIDCGEFQMEHEVAKLIGAPPGYLGHRETVPMLNQQRLNAVTSERSNLSIVLLDEIEKAASSMNRLLLGVLDKALLRLGDNATVNFERSLIIFTSNLGVKEIQRARINPHKDFAAARQCAIEAARKHFSPEFFNRLDEVCYFRPLNAAAISRILDLELAKLQIHINTRLGARTIKLHVTESALDALTAWGFSEEFGARALRRVIKRKLLFPLANDFDSGVIKDCSTVTVIHASPGDTELTLIADKQRRRSVAAAGE